jgi:hypothetical protein
MRRLLATAIAGLVLAAAAYFAVALIRPASRLPGAAPAAPSAAPTPSAPPRSLPQSGESSPPPPRPRPAPLEDSSTGTAGAAPDTATLRITCDVPGAMVFIDRKYLGNAPVTARGLTPGPHRLNVAKEGYDGIAEQIDVAAGSRTIHLRMADRKR